MLGYTTNSYGKININNADFKMERNFFLKWSLCDGNIVFFNDNLIRIYSALKLTISVILSLIQDSDLDKDEVLLKKNILRLDFEIRNHEILEISLQF